MSDAIPRQIPRREVLAFIALNGDEHVMPRAVEFREYHHGSRDWHMIDLAVDTEDAVQHWAGVFGHPVNRIRRSDWTATDGRPVHTVESRGDWRGWTTSVETRIRRVASEPLDAATEAQLREVAKGGEPSCESA